MVNQQLLEYIKQQLQKRIETEDIKKVLVAKGWDESEVVEAINIAKNGTMTSSSQNDSNKNFFSRRLLIGVTFIILLLLGGSAFFFKVLNISKEKPQQSISKGPLITTPTPLSVLQGEIMQSLERNPTEKVVAQEVYVSLRGETKRNGSGYSGSIKEGIGFPAKEEDKKEQEKWQQQIKNDPKASNSLFLLEARDKNNQVLLEEPVAVVDETTGGDVLNYSYQDPGFFFKYLLLPLNMNSIVLRTRSGEVLDRVYVEDWEPEVKISNYPKSIGSTDKFQVDIELLPAGKAYSYSLFLKNAKDGSSMGMIEGSLQPQSGKMTRNIDLHQYPFTTTDNWVIEAVGYSLFQSRTTVSEPISITLSSENIEVKISGKDKTTRTSGESDYLSWSHTFYGVDVTRGLKDLCKKGRCFELTWTGEGVQFNEKYWEFKPVSSVTTQITSLECLFRGSGKQSIHLEVKENGKIIGEDTYTYTVSGIGSEPTLCAINDY